MRNRTFRATSPMPSPMPSLVAMLAVVTFVPGLTLIVPSLLSSK